MEEDRRTDDAAETQGALARLRSNLRLVPPSQARAVREIAQKECEADLKANDAILVRANQLMAAGAVALTLLVGLSKEAVINCTARRVLLCVALVAAAIAVGLVVLCTRVRGAHTQIKNSTIAGVGVTETSDAVLWARDHELSVAREYIEIRQALTERHSLRAGFLSWAQNFYVVFVAAVIALGIAIVA